MNAMFMNATVFNSDLSDWNVSSVKYMSVMFYNAKNFDQVLCWDTLVNAKNMFLGSKGGSINPNC